MASSREIAAKCLKLELRWIKLAEKADAAERLSGRWGKAEAVTEARK